jgi:hypothetical protein
MFCINKSPVHTPVHTPLNRSRANSLDNVNVNANVNANENIEDRIRELNQILMEAGFIENDQPRHSTKSIKITKISPINN